MNQDQVKEVLLELLDGNEKRGRKWFFPKNVDNQYKVFLNMTVKEIAVYILPAILISVGIAALPPYSSVIFWMIKLLFIVVIITIPVFFVNYRPIKQRDNIRSQDYLKEILNNSKKKKVYFMKPKDKFIER